MRWSLLLLLGAFAAALAHAAPTEPVRPALIAPLLLEAENLGDVWIYPDPVPERFEIETDGLARALAKGLRADFWEGVSRKLGPLPKVSLAAVVAAGVPIRFDEAALTLRLEPAAGTRARPSLTVRRNGGPDERETVGPAAVSGYLNATASQGFLYPAATSREPLGGNLSLVSNVRGLVLETGATYREKDPYPWRRDDTRLSRDFEDSLLRLSAGDVPILGVGYQGSRPIGGVSLTRQYSIQPYLNTRPLSRTEIDLKRPSTIEVYVNDGFVNRLNAPAGPLSLSDFPLFSGVNKVDLKITDDAGRTEWVNLNLLYDVQLLGRGVSEFAYQVGAPTTPAGFDRTYDADNLTVSAFHRRGVTDRLTLGAGFQADRTMWMGSGEFAYLTQLGLFSGETALSRRLAAPASGVGRLRFKSLDYQKGNDRPWRGTLEVEYRSRLFAALGQGALENPFSWSYNATLSRPLTALTSLSLGAGYQQNRLGMADQRSVRADLSTEVGPRLRLAASYELARSEQTQHRAQATLTWTDLGGKYYGNFSYDYPSRTIRAEGTRNSASVADDYRATVGAQRSPAASQVDALLDYNHEKANLRLEHVSRDVKGAAAGAETGTRHHTQLTASTAVAWAGGVVAWTRPVADSFAILAASPQFRGFDLPVNESDAGAEAHVNRVGPGVVPTLTAYTPTPLHVRSAGLPFGYSLGREYFLVRPTYRSGTLLRVGGESAVLLSGTLLRPNGAPLAFGTGVVRARGEANAPALFDFFTNGEGYFLLENLSPGAYEVVVDGYRPVPLDIPAGAAGFQKFPPHRLEVAE